MSINKIMKETTFSIVKNTKAMLIAQIITWVSSFALMMFLPRYLGAEAYGRLYLAISVTALQALMIDLGLSTFFVKEVARDRSKVNLFFMNSAALRVIVWLVTMAGMYIYVIATGYSSELMIIVLLLGFGTLLTSMSDLAYRIFQSFELLTYRSYAVVIERVSLALIAIPMLVSGCGVISIALVMTLSVSLSFTASMFLLPKVVHLKLQVRPTTWLPLVRGALPFFISTFFSFVYFRINVVMLSAMTSDRVVGWYGAPFKLFDTLMFFPVILQTVVFPVFSRLWAESAEGFATTAKGVLDSTVVMAVMISFLLFALARPIVGFLFGLKDYENSVILLKGLALCLPLVYTNFVISTVDVTSDKQKELSVISIIAAFINIGLNFWIIPFFQRVYGNGAIGAMIATITTEMCVMVMFIYLLPQGCFGKQNILVTVKAVMAGIIAGLVVWYLEGSLIHVWYVDGVIGGAIYTLLLIGEKVLTKREWNLLVRFLPLRLGRTRDPAEQAVTEPVQL
ncbi:MAG TPA: flippase [Bacteroidota bacterium]|nr:flippase [Bacteroidota bacterium]